MEEKIKGLVENIDSTLESVDYSPEAMAQLVTEHRVLMTAVLEQKREAGESIVSIDHPQWVIDSWKRDPIRATAMIRLLRMHASNIEMQFALTTGGIKQ